MKSVLLSAMVAFTLVGCTSITTMTPAQFNQLSSTQIPFSGNWTGTGGEALTVLQLNRQGNGKLCIDNNKDVMSYRIKLVNNVLYTDQGLKLNVKTINAAQATLQIRILGLGATFELNKDDALKHITPSCKAFINA